MDFKKFFLFVALVLVASVFSKANSRQLNLLNKHKRSAQADDAVTVDWCNSAFKFFPNFPKRYLELYCPQEKWSELHALFNHDCIKWPLQNWSLLTKFLHINMDLNHLRFIRQDITRSIHCKHIYLRQTQWMQRSFLLLEFY